MTDDINPNNQRYALVVQALDRALVKPEIELHYQGQYELTSGSLTGLEVLSRLNDEVLGHVPADEFIRVAEQAGRISDWEEKVWQQVQLEWPALDAHWPDIRLALNFSLRHIAQEKFFDKFEQWLFALDHSHQQRLDFEITETWIQQLSPAQTQRLKQLQTSGVRIVMDDFGTGQSSLSRLHTLAFDCIKLDKEFTQHIAEPMVQAIVRAMAQLTQSFHKSLIIEGVETETELDTLKELGASIVQGYLLGKPQPLASWLALARPQPLADPTR
jgi:EAL domain-containing protein (putative c-di-GMP-specific phosphodiesterase class I)